MAHRMSIDKKDSLKDDSEDSMGSSPEGDLEAITSTAPQENQAPKRKGGRKPIYATSEERKQRNRQAQAAFRERRTEYIKQLEETIRVHEQNLHNLQTAHRNAADECLMLRYKNSLLERILLEKGIDVQAELRAKTGSPNLGPTHMPQNLVQPPPIQRALLNRHHSRRNNSGLAPKRETGVNVTPIPTALHSGHTPTSAASPINRPTPPSHSASPSATNSFGSQPGASPAGSASDHPSTQLRHSLIPGGIKPQVSNMAPPPKIQQQPPQLTAGHAGVGVGFYSTPAYQNHLEQLEQEYDAAADLMDDPVDRVDTPSGPGPYPGSRVAANFTSDPQAMSLSSPTTSAPIAAGQPLLGQPVTDLSQAQPAGFPSMTQLLDPGLDWDPFGLSASMAFPSQFTFDTSNLR